MFNELEKELKQVIQSGLHAAIASKLGGYNSPLDAVLKDVFARYDGEIRTLLVNSIQSAMTDEDFRQRIADAVRSKLAKTLIDRFGGELEKQVNALKSDPTTRAKITLAIEEVVKSQVK